MNEAVDYAQTKAFLVALLSTQPRILAMFVAIPIFNSQIIPGMLRFSIAAGIGLLVAPRLAPTMSITELGALQALLLITKEAFIGFTLGFLIAIPFWSFEAVGFFIDNQRGASISATLNPLTGNDSSPMGILFNQAFIVFFFSIGGFFLLLNVVYDSFRLWDVLSWSPTLRPESMQAFLDQLSNMVRVAVLLCAPAIVAMFLAEIGLALISRFVPQLDVFFLAMPIKSALALVVLLVYLVTLFDYAQDHVEALRNIMPFLNKHWATYGLGAP
ncbi:MAG: EscT/YscT/HrcT family type secretion system export apparatus protein [Proteobacteria bacterium]|nr:EscT/YscT/HrcT family type secretion system export apparatus protein [Pseudomonadota bacterium]